MKMTFSPLENSLLMEVVGTPCSAVELYEKYVEKNRCSRAGFYKSLASLKKKEVIIEKDGMISINKIWLADSYDFFRKLIQRKTTPSYLAEQVAQLKEGDRLSYTFHSIADIDIFILNLLYDLLLLKLDKQALILEAHEFFVLLNDARTKRILKELSSTGNAIHLLIESNTAIDKEVVKNHLPKSATAYVSGKKSADTSRIVHVVGDVCIELKLNKSLTASMDRLFTKDDEVTEDFLEGLKDLVSKKQKHEIIIYCSKQKSQRIKKRFGKYFLV